MADHAENGNFLEFKCLTRTSQACRLNHLVETMVIINLQVLREKSLMVGGVVQFLYFFSGELEIEEVEVLLNPRRGHRLGNDGDVSVHRLTEEDLHILLL